MKTDFGSKVEKDSTKADIPCADNTKTTMSKTAKFLDYILNSKSKSTFKQYKMSINLFTTYFNETHNTDVTSDDLIEMRKQDFLTEDMEQQKRFHREIEKFHKWMTDGKKDKDGKWIRERYEINSARNLTLGMIQLFKYYGYLTNVSFETVVTTKDFVPTIQQYRDMFNCADLRARVIISMGLDLGWRISDFLRIEKDSLPDLNQEAPISVDTITQKCNVVAKSFLSSESIELLKSFLPTLRPENPYLFQSNSHSSLDPETVGDILKNLADKAKIKMPKDKRLRFHCFRKRFLSTCADLKIDVNTAKLLVGKDVEKSMLTYLSEVEHKKAFIEVKTVLTLMNGKRNIIEGKDVEIEKLKKENEQLRTMFKLLAEAQSETVTKALLKKLKAEGYHEAIVFGGPPDTTVLIEGEKVKLEPIHGQHNAQNVIEKLLEIEQLKQDRAYKKLIENGNGNGNNHTS